MDRSAEKYQLQLEASRKWKEENPERHAELARAYRKRNPEKIRAQNQLNYALRKGVVVRPACEGCGATENVHAHHHDYSKPLDVHWFCYKCHKKQHPVTAENKAIKFEDAKHAQPKGSDNPAAVLNEKLVREIKRMLSCGITQTRLAEIYGVSQMSISRIERGETWKHVTI